MLAVTRASNADASRCFSVECNKPPPAVTIRGHAHAFYGTFPFDDLASTLYDQPGLVSAQALALRFRMSLGAATQATATKEQLLEKARAADYTTGIDTKRAVGCSALLDDAPFALCTTF